MTKVTETSIQFTTTPSLWAFANALVDDEDIGQAAEDVAQSIATILSYDVDTPRRLRLLASAFQREAARMENALTEDAAINEYQQDDS